MFSQYEIYVLTMQNGRFQNLNGAAEVEIIISYFYILLGY